MELNRSGRARRGPGSECRSLLCTSLSWVKAGKWLVKGPPRWIGTGSQPHGIQRCGPRGAARFQGDDPRIGPARDHEVLVLAAAVGMAERARIAGGGVRSKPRRDVHGEDQPTVGRPRQHHRGQRSSQPGDLDAALVEAAVQRTVPTSVLGCQRASPTSVFTGPSAPHTAGHRSVRTGRLPARSRSRRSPPGSATVARSHLDRLPRVAETSPRPFC